MSAEANIPNVGFVACIEGGVLEAQALLLFESIRHYAGRFRDCPIYSLSPRAGHGISRSARAKLDELKVKHTDVILNTECREYGSANRVAAAAYIEETYPHEILVVLDSDTLFLREPDKILLPTDIDVAVRPVDLKGMCTNGPGDPFDRYWRDLCRCCGVDYEGIPWNESFVDRRRIKATYNGGLVVVRGEIGILRRWADFFFASVREGLTPYSTDRRFRSGAGWVDPAAGRLWGSNQAALSLAIWSNTRRVQVLPPTYNYPLTLHDKIDAATAKAVFPHLVHVHYHWLLDEKRDQNPLFDSAGPLSSRQHDWLGSATAERLREQETSVIAEVDNSDAVSVPAPICIAGMHRSGTSLVASLLHACDLFLGPAEEFMQPSPDNPEGYWENIRFVNLNDRLLTQFGGYWSKPPSLPAQWEFAPEIDSLFGEAEALVGRFSDRKYWGWKDPRNSLTLPFWQRLIPNLQVVVCVRNPLEVSSSLFARGDAKDSSQFSLWLAYYRRLLAAVPPKQLLVTHYQSFLHNARAEVRRLSDGVGLQVTDEVVEQACSQVVTGLRHHQATTAQLLAPNVPAEVLHLYLNLCAEAGPVYRQIRERERSGELEPAAFAVVPPATIPNKRLLRKIERLHQLESELREHHAGGTLLTGTQKQSSRLFIRRTVRRARKALRAVKSRF
ncbi:MAG: Sulfotransferase family [Acidobacteria bacterium]|nr:Sulfotransferase family [Acidobacteriota bacterium]